MPSSCPRCERGVKNDWDYCPWCYGPGFIEETTRRYPDKRYVTRCSNKRCRGELMPFMRYCPWCRMKVRRAWKLAGSRHSCKACGWGIAQDDGSTGQDLLPSVNPTFEWIRLAQRIPVRIHLTKIPQEVNLRVGTTASVLVMTDQESRQTDQSQ